MPERHDKKPVGRTRTVTVRMDEELHGALKAVAGLEGISVEALVRREMRKRCDVIYGEHLNKRI